MRRASYETTRLLLRTRASLKVHTCRERENPSRSWIPPCRTMDQDGSVLAWESIQDGGLHGPRSVALRAATPTSGSASAAWRLLGCFFGVSGFGLLSLSPLWGKPESPGPVGAALSLILACLSQQVSGGCIAARPLERAVSGDLSKFAGMEGSGPRCWAAVSLTRLCFSTQAGPGCQPLWLWAPDRAPGLVLCG